ncbi:MAG TPA: hypothetical protein DEO82_01270 [Eubacterium sp.]|nr:hypothetical protein [Eubacterium sp.]
MLFKKIKINRWLFALAATVFFFLLLVEEAISGLYVNKVYKNQSIYGKETYAFFHDPMLTIKYRDMVNTGVDIENLSLSKVAEKEEGHISFAGYNYSIKEHGIPSDDTEFAVEDVLVRYFNDIFFPKYKDSLYYTRFSFNNEDMYYIKSHKDEVYGGYIYGPEKLAIEGRMCTNVGECVVVGRYNIGDYVEYEGNLYEVVGKINIINYLPVVSIFAAIFERDVYEKMNRYNTIFMSYEDLQKRIREAEKPMDEEYYWFPDKFVFDKSKITEEDMNILKTMGVVKSLKETYGRYAGAYVYIACLFPILPGILMFLCGRKYVRSYKL